MRLKRFTQRAGLLAALAVAGAVLPWSAQAATCKAQAQMTGPERDLLAGTTRTLVGEIKTGNAEGLRSNTLPAVAADFSGIAATVDNLKTLIGSATITVDSLFSLDSSTEAPGAARTDFFCGSPVVVLNIPNLPPGIYALALVHATGVPKPQQIALILAQGPDHRWMLGGLIPKAMTDAGHDGLWYWTSARQFAQKKMNWDAWFYYRIAAYYLSPVDFLSSPNLEKLQQEQEQVKPDNLPGEKPLTLGLDGASYQVTSIDTTTELGPFDLDVQYSPDSAQVAQLRDPQSARKEVTQVMLALLSQHPELQSGFHGIWVHANQGSNSLFSLELPMDQIVQAQSAPVTR
jgi:hypothetical protein